MHMSLTGDRCDFCNIRGNHKWNYKVKPFTMMFIVSEHGIEEHVSGDWGACDNCHNLIQKNKWDELLNRSMKVQNVPESEKDFFVRNTTKLWEAVRKNLTDVIRE